MNCYVRHVLHDKPAISLWLKEAGRNLQQDALAHAEQPAPLPASRSGTAHTQQSRDLLSFGLRFSATRKWRENASPFGKQKYG